MGIKLVTLLNDRRDSPDVFWKILYHISSRGLSGHSIDLVNKKKGKIFVPLSGSVFFTTELQ